MQQTLKRPIRLVGAGLHSGRPARLTISPAVEDYGIVFVRTDLATGEGVIPARYDLVYDSKLCTALKNDQGATISTVEHLMAALAGCGVHNALIECDGPEIPIMDGSSRRFVKEILGAGVVVQDAPLRAVRVLRPISVRENGASAELSPDSAFSIAFAIDFEDEAIGSQSSAMDLSGDTFVSELADCRTFCRKEDVEAMQAVGLARGGSLDNAVVVSGAEVLNPEGLRRSDEFVRHKMLDALGDLALAGAPILGSYRSERGGHRMTNLLLRALFADAQNWCYETVDQRAESKLPGMSTEETGLAQVG